MIWKDVNKHPSVTYSEGLLFLFYYKNHQTTPMEIKHRKLDQKGEFYIEVNGQMAAQMTYVYAGDTRIIIDHTDVGSVLRGQGAGKQLVQAAVEFARQNHLHILPLCPFAKSVFDKTPEWKDVL